MVIFHSYVYVYQRVSILNLFYSFLGCLHIRDTHTGWHTTHPNASVPQKQKSKYPSIASTGNLQFQTTILFEGEPTKNTEYFYRFSLLQTFISALICIDIHFAWLRTIPRPMRKNTSSTHHIPALIKSRNTLAATHHPNVVIDQNLFYCMIFCFPVKARDQMLFTQT